ELPAGKPLHGLALVAHGGKLYRQGGKQPRNKPGDPTDNFSTASCSVFDPKTKKWDKLPDLPAGRSSHDAVVVGDTIVVVGGWTLNGKEGQSVWAEQALLLDLTKQPLAWQAVPQPFKRRALNAAALEGKVYVVCGMSAARRTERTIDVLDVATRKWTTAPELPGPPRNGFSPAACVSGGRLFVSPSNGTVYRLNQKEEGWEEVANLDERRIVHRMVPAGELLLVLGGATRGANLAAVEAIKPGAGKPVPAAND
ncbi:MAG: Kelch repeat-containing protein, partial [Gemmataceae bacterium]